MLRPAGNATGISGHDRCRDERTAVDGKRIKKTTDQTRNCAGSGMRKRADLRTTACRWHAARYTGVEIADSVPCGEIAMCSRVGRWGRLSDDGPRQHNSNQSEDPWGGGRPNLHDGARSSARPDTGRDPLPEGDPFASSSSRSFNTSRTEISLRSYGKRRSAEL